MILEAPIYSAHDTSRNVVGTIATVTQTHMARSWRIDSNVREENAGFPSKVKNMRDRIMQWQESPEYPEFVLIFILPPLEQTIREVPPRSRKPTAIPLVPERPSVPRGHGRPTRQ